MIRELAAGDRDRWLALWDAYHAFYGRAGATALPREVTDTTWRRFFDASEPMHALVAEHAGEVAGIAHYLFHRTTTAIAHTCYLQDLFVAPEARGQGLASALIVAVRERARAAGATRLYWQTHETNEVAQRVYARLAERSGFVVYRIALG